MSISSAYFKIVLLCLFAIPSFSQELTSYQVILDSATNNPSFAYDAFESYANQRPLDSTLLVQYKKLLKVFEINNDWNYVDQLNDKLFHMNPKEGVEEQYLEALRVHIKHLNRRNNFDSTLLYVERMHELAIRFASDHYQFCAWIFQAGVSLQKGENEKSFDCYFKALEMAIASKDTVDLFTAYNNISLNYELIDDFVSAKSYAKKALSLESKSIQPSQYAQHYSNYGLLLNKMEQYDSAIWSQRKSLSYSKQVNLTYGLLIGHLNLSVSLRASGKVQEALNELDSITDLVQEFKQSNMIMLVQFNKALCNAELEDYPQAIAYGERALALAEKNDAWRDIRNVTQNLADWYEKVGNWKSSLKRFKQFVHVSDSIRIASDERTLGENKSREDLIISNNQKELLETSLAYESKVKTGLVILSSLLLVFVGTIGYFLVRMRKLNQVVSRQKEELENLNELKSEFFANISHEIRTPLTLIQGNLEMLERNGLDESDRKQRTANARRNATQLKYMIDDLLDLSKLELGQYKFMPRLVQMRLFTSRIIASFQSLSDERQVALLFNSDTTDRLAASIDARQFEKVLSNLLYNAFKFSSPGKTVEVRLEATESKVILSVIDQGIGIRDVDLPNIFNRFYKSSDSVNAEGSGLGLAIVKEIVEFHEGTIRVESTDGVGSTFTIEIPRADDIQDVEQETSELIASARALIQEKSLTWALSRPKILLVEDNKEMQDYLHEILSESFDLSICGNGVEALHFLANTQPHLIISDVMMPVMDGFELLHKVKNDPTLKPIPFMLLTARGGQDDRMAGLRLGVDDYITKPFDQEELLIKVCNLIDNLNERLKWANENEEDTKFPSSTTSSEDNHLVDMLKQYVEEHITDPNLSVPDLAREVGLSERQLYRKTTGICGLTPNQFVMEVRLQQARKLLLKGEITKLSHLASEVGIGTSSYLSKQFYLRFGKRPSDFIS